MIELRKLNLLVQPQVPVNVFYEGQLVGEYFADLLVDNCVILELKALEALASEHHAQILITCNRHRGGIAIELWSETRGETEDLRDCPRELNE